ncbi:unnamed protein product [Owenia fusiformis]|uniref:FERM domain-containing protein 8 n=1 Tax=Owenia fusiformis TaxID=6347 RepID=A0A8S4PDN0_OWEFU|nr:unnamed protein product [Owenia fusiformis]
MAEDKAAIDIKTVPVDGTGDEEDGEHNKALQGSTLDDTEKNEKDKLLPKITIDSSASRQKSYITATRPDSYGMTSAMSDASAKPLEMCVYFANKTGLEMTLEGGRCTTAEEVFEQLMELLSLPSEARDVFCLWLISPLLELQLKPHHVPFRLTQHWDELLQKYTTSSEEEIERDEPVLIMQRNIYYPRELEEKIREPQMLKLLYSEAHSNITEGRYPWDTEHYFVLAGLASAIENGQFDEVVHTADFYRENLSQFFPHHMCKPKTTFFGKPKRDSIEFQLVQEHRSTSDQFRNHSIEDLQYKYLQCCWNLPYYGCAFFAGQIERPRSGLGLFGNPDMDVYIAVNKEGVFIIDDEKARLLLGLVYKDFSWEYAESAKSQYNPSCLPCLFIQFKDDLDGDGKYESKILQVFSKQAVMADVLIQTFVKLIHTFNDMTDAGGGDTVDGAPPILNQINIKENQEKFSTMLRSRDDLVMCSKLDKLCLATHNMKKESS